MTTRRKALSPGGPTICKSVSPEPAGRLVASLHSSPGNPKTWSPCKCEMKMRRTWLGITSVSIMRCCVASPQSKSQVSPPRRTPSPCWFRVLVGAPLLVPKKVSSTVSRRLLSSAFARVLSPGTDLVLLDARSSLSAWQSDLLAPNCRVQVRSSDRRTLTRPGTHANDARLIPPAFARVAACARAGRRVGGSLWGVNARTGQRQHAEQSAREFFHVPVSGSSTRTGTPNRNELKRYEQPLVVGWRAGKYIPTRPVGSRENEKSRKKSVLNKI